MDMKHDKVTPYNTGKDKTRQVAEMFNNISKRYDLLNDILSLGIHKGWRKKCVALLRDIKPRNILDVATGTGDFAIECLRLHPEKVTGIDISTGMLALGREKIKKLGLEGKIELLEGNAETIGLPGNSMDAIVVGFGVRNFADLEKGLVNLHRMLRPGGRLVVLEFSYPRNLVVKASYNFYFSYITPLVGRMFSRDRRAYSYLTESVKAFPNNELFVTVLEKCGFIKASYKPLSMGIAAIYVADK